MPPHLLPLLPAADIAPYPMHHMGADVYTHPLHTRLQCHCSHVESHRSIHLYLALPCKLAARITPNLKLRCRHTCL
jgi:hypothetical protein